MGEFEKERERQKKKGFVKNGEFDGKENVKTCTRSVLSYVEIKKNVKKLSLSEKFQKDKEIRREREQKRRKYVCLSGKAIIGLT